MEWIKNPTGRIITLPFILNPNYQEINLVKSQIKWCEETTNYFLRVDFNYQLFSEYINQAEKLKDNLKKLAR
jgi:hypothetical protein